MGMPPLAAPNLSKARETMKNMDKTERVSWKGRAYHAGIDFRHCRGGSVDFKCFSRKTVFKCIQILSRRIRKRDNPIIQNLELLRSPSLETRQPDHPPKKPLSIRGRKFGGVPSESAPHRNPRSPCPKQPHSPSL